MNAAGISQAGVKVLSALLEQYTGQQVAPGRAYRIDNAVRPLLRDHGFDSADELVAAVLRDPSGVLSETIVEALLNQETSFFRDSVVIDNLAEALSNSQDGTSNRRPRVWSAGCSTGQEPLSLAIALAERAQGDTAAFADVVATDVSPAAIARARAGRYTQFEIQRGLPMRRMIRWFDQVDTDWVANADIVRKVSYRRHNLVADVAPPGQFDAILCRNVLMYFSPSIRRSVFEKLSRALRPGGVLVLGAGETVIGQTEAFIPSRRFRGFYDAVPAVSERIAAAG